MAPSRPDVRYARSGELSIAYRVVGDGPIDLVYVPGFISHLDLAWEIPPFRRFTEELARFARVVTFDKRGTGLSDRDLGIGTIEDRMDDVRAVMDDAGLGRAAVMGISEGGPMATVFAATYPDRVTSLVLCGTFARTLWAPDYPQGIAPERTTAFVDHIRDVWGTGRSIPEFFAHTPDDDGTREVLARYERASASPRIAAEILRRNIEIDVRAALPAVAAPALVIHNRDDPIVPLSAAHYVAEHLRRARLVEVEGDFHVSWRPSDTARIIDLVEEFLTGEVSRHEIDRVLKTVLFTDIVGSTEQAADLGDSGWRRVLDAHDELVRKELDRHRGVEVKTTGDGFLAAFDGPARAIRCARAIAASARAAGVEVRAGLHAGECELRGDDLAGLTVHIGARVAAHAGPGEVLVSSTVRDLVAGSGITFDDRGTHELKGVPGEWQLLAVTAA